MRREKQDRKLEQAKKLEAAKQAISKSEKYLELSEEECQEQFHITEILLEVCLFVCGGSLMSGQLFKGSFRTA